MPQPRITPDQRAGQVYDLVPQLVTATQAAQAATTGWGHDDQRTRDAWAVVADLAGQVQRRTRQLAGLGRGG